MGLKFPLVNNIIKSLKSTVKFAEHIHAPQRKHPLDFDDPNFQLFAHHISHFKVCTESYCQPSQRLFVLTDLLNIVRDLIR